MYLPRCPKRVVPTAVSCHPSEKTPVGFFILRPCRARRCCHRNAMANHESESDSDATENTQDTDGPPFSCLLCGVHTLTSRVQLAEHLTGRRHKRAERRASGATDLTCDLCGVRVTGASEMAHHKKGKRHRAKLREFAARAEEALDDLATLNRWLVKLSLPEESSKTAARAAVKSVHINIFDLVEERFEPVFPSVKELLAYTRKNDKFFPKQQAKEGGVLKLFLRVFFGRGRHSAGKSAGED